MARGKLACPSSQIKARHGEAVGPLGKPLVEVSGSSEIIHLDKQAKTPKHYEVVWRKGQSECGFECEGEKYPYTRSQTHSDSCTPPAFTVLGVEIECVKYISHTHTSNSRCFFECEVEKYPHTPSQTHTDFSSPSAFGGSLDHRR